MKIKVEDRSTNQNGTKKLNNYKKSEMLQRIYLNKFIYVLFIPIILQFIIFRYATLYGLKIAFLDYNVFDGYNSPWVGWKNFEVIFRSAFFPKLLKNTVILSVMRIILGFPAPIIIALLLNEMKNKFIRRTSQTLLYLPHFLNWVIIYGIFYILFNDFSGVVKHLFDMLGWKYVDFTTKPQNMRLWLVLSGIWKGMGWGSIIYLAAISGINTEMYESAIIDGANRFKQIWYITLPTIFPIMAIQLVLSTASILGEDLTQIFTFTRLNPILLESVEVFETWIYQYGLQGGSFSVATAISLFQTVVGLILTLITNKIASKFGYEVLW
ncbi:MAG TPA: sugar ABC transporter permease [Clostridiaceae bacterium]|nr:sugar ABC transporter permease [Clostridiaceae bacterium]